MYTPAIYECSASIIRRHRIDDFNGTSDVKVLDRPIVKDVLENGFNTLYYQTTRADSTTQDFTRYSTLYDWAKGNLIFLQNIPDAMSVSDWWDIFGETVENLYGEDFRKSKKRLEEQEETK